MKTPKEKALIMSVDMHDPEPKLHAGEAALPKASVTFRKAESQIKEFGPSEVSLDEGVHGLLSGKICIQKQCESEPRCANE